MLKMLTKKFIHHIGWDIHRLSPRTNPEFQLLKSLNRVNVNLIFDIGANTGQFSQKLRTVGYREKIVSFEPLSSAYHDLSAAARRDPKWHIHSRIAIGDYDGETEINIAGNSASSSVLPMLDAHTAAAPGSAYVGKERVPIARLDSIAPAYLTENTKYFLKIDTQGFEWNVLNGASETLRQARGVLCELSLVPLYQGQRLWRDIIDRLEAKCFTLWAIQGGFTDPCNGRSLQIDGIFLKDDAKRE